MRCFLNEKVLQTNDETQWNPYRFVVHVIVDLLQNVSNIRMCIF